MCSFVCACVRVWEQLERVCVCVAAGVFACGWCFAGAPGGKWCRRETNKKTPAGQTDRIGTDAGRRTHTCTCDDTTVSHRRASPGPLGRGSRGGPRPLVHLPNVATCLPNVGGGAGRETRHTCSGPRLAQASSSPQSRATARLALVLDIDGTLIDSTDFDTVIHKRPGVDAFLDDCFSSFAAVAIWTHAGSDWARHVTQHVLIDADGRPRPWAFVWSASRASAKRKPIEHMFDLHPARDYIKPLLKVWRGKKRAAAGFTRDRTIIVEDTPSNCKSNYGNAIYVPTFQAGDWSDNTLPLLSLHLDELDAHVRAQGISVRYVEKRWWSTEVVPPCCCFSCLLARMDLDVPDTGAWTP